MFNKGNNGGGNPNHDENGRFTSKGGASSGKKLEYNSFDNTQKSFISDDAIGEINDILSGENDDYVVDLGNGYSISFSKDVVYGDDRDYNYMLDIVDSDDNIIGFIGVYGKDFDEEYQKELEDIIRNNEKGNDDAYEQKLKSTLGISEPAKEDKDYAEQQKYFNVNGNWTNELQGLKTGLGGQELTNYLKQGLGKRGISDVFVDDYNPSDNMVNFVATDNQGYKVEGWYDRNTGRLGLGAKSIQGKDDKWYQDKLKSTLGIENKDNSLKQELEEMGNKTDNKYGITLSNAVKDLKKYPEDSLLGDERAINQLMNRFGLSRRDVIRYLNYAFDGKITDKE